MNRLDSLAFCWRIERRDGAGLALTSLDRPLHVDGVDYQPAPGMLPSAIVRGGPLDPSAAQVDGALSSGSISEEDLKLGRWNGANVRLTAVHWDAVDDGPCAELLNGELGDIRVEDGKFATDLLGPAAKLDAAVCPSTSSSCRAEFGDPQCGVDLAGRSRRATVASADGQRVVVSPSVSSDFTAGGLTVVSGRATGWRAPIQAVVDGALHLRDLPPASLEPGAILWIDEGCDKRFATCCSRFANAHNFRGEPHLPGNDLLTRYPGG